MITCPCNVYPTYTHAIIQAQINCTVSAQLISAFVFTTRLVQSPYFFNLIFLYAVAWLGCTLHVTWLYVTCNVQPSQATANPVDGKACSSTKGGLLRYIPNTYSIHKVSSLKFAYFQGKLSRYMIKMYRYEFFTVFDLMSALVPKIAHPDRFRKTCAARLAHSSTGVWISYIKFTR